MTAKNKQKTNPILPSHKINTHFFQKIAHKTIFSIIAWSIFYITYYSSQQIQKITNNIIIYIFKLDSNTLQYFDIKIAILMPLYLNTTLILLTLSTHLFSKPIPKKTTSLPIQTAIYLLIGSLIALPSILFLPQKINQFTFKMPFIDKISLTVSYSLYCFFILITLLQQLLQTHKKPPTSHTPQHSSPNSHQENNP